MIKDGFSSLSEKPAQEEWPKLESKPVLSELSVVIPTLGRPLLLQCLQSLAMGSHWPFQIVVVDQGANPDLATWCAKLAELGLNTRHLKAPMRGRAAAVNRGVEAVETPFLAVTDDDCLVTTEWAREIYGELKKNPGAIVTGRVTPGGNERVLAVITLTEPQIYRRPRVPFDTLCGGNMGAPRAVVVRLGLFDEDPRIRCAEDCEFAYRSLSLGVPIIYAPQVVVVHLGWRSEGERKLQYRDYARSLGGFFGKYLRRGDLRIALRVVVHHLRALRRWLLGMARGDRELQLHGWAYLTGTLPGIAAGMRRKIPE